MPRSSPLDDLIRKGVQERRTEAARNVIDWAERREWWKRQIDTLNAQVLDWFQLLVDEQIVQYQKKTLSLSEERLGAYQIDALTLLIDGASFEIIPVATLVVGGFGRVDVAGTAGHATLILAASDEGLPMPARRDTAKFPPVLFVTATRDFATSNAIYSHNQLAKVGVESDLRIWDGLGRGSILDDLPDAMDANNIIVNFFDKHLSGKALKRTRASGFGL